MHKSFSVARKLMLGLTAGLTIGCSDYQLLLRSQDYEQWYIKGMEYYAAGDYDKAANLLGGVLSRNIGTARYDTLITTYAHALVKTGDYYSAASYFSDYVKTYPSSSKCPECQFMAGYCYYKLSPKVELDQADSQQAIDELQAYLNLYHEDGRTAEAEQMIKEMTDKLAYKDYMSAKLYFNLGDYMGNNYNSAVIVAQNTLRKYPDTKHREELSYLILRSKYIQADRSTLRRQPERYRDAIDEYYSFINEYPESKYRKDADRMLRSSEKGLADAEKLIPPSKDDMDYYLNFGTLADQERERQRNIDND